MTILEITGVGSVIGAGVMAQIPTASIEAAGKWPVTIALIALSALSVFLAFRMAEKTRVMLLLKKPALTEVLVGEAADLQHQMVMQDQEIAFRAIMSGKYPFEMCNQCREFAA